MPLTDPSARRALAVLRLPLPAAAAAATFALVACAVPVTSPPLTPPPLAAQVVGRPGGAAEVAFRDGCRLRFDARGRETGHTAVCARDQRDHARALINDRWREPDDTWRQRAPEAVIARNGAGRVLFRDGCSVDYDRDGDRRDRSNACSRDEVRDADRAMAARRRELGLDGGDRAPLPEVVLARNGSGRVVYRDGCTVDYDRDGDRRAHSRDCSAAQLRHADAEVAAKRRRHGWDGTGNSRPGGAPDRVSARTGTPWCVSICSARCATTPTAGVWTPAPAATRHG